MFRYLKMRPHTAQNYENATVLAPGDIPCFTSFISDSPTCDSVILRPCDLATCDSATSDRFCDPSVHLSSSNQSQQRPTPSGFLLSLLLKFSTSLSNFICFTAILSLFGRIPLISHRISHIISSAFPLFVLFGFSVIFGLLVPFAFYNFNP